MTHDEREIRRLRIVMYVLMVLCIILMISLILVTASEKARFEPSESSDEEIIEKDAIWVDLPQIQTLSTGNRVRGKSAVKPVTKIKLQTAAEETEKETVIPPKTEPVMRETVAQETTTAAPETTAAAPPETTAPPAPAVKTWYVCGMACPVEITTYLEQTLTQAGIGWWMPYAVGQIYTESHWNTGAVSPDGLDMGILQYRQRFWASSCAEVGQPLVDIFDWHAQINVYVNQTARRLSSGCSIEVAISRHKQSDYGPYDATYVQLVLQWTGTVYSQ